MAVASNNEITKNMKVTKAGYMYYGHFRSGELKIVLESSNCGCTIYPKDQYNLYDLFNVFDVPCEDGAYIEDIVGKFCRVTFNSKSESVILQHICNDKVFWIDRDKKDN